MNDYWRKRKQEIRLHKKENKMFSIENYRKILKNYTTIYVCGKFYLDNVS